MFMIIPSGDFVLIYMMSTTFRASECAQDYHTLTYNSWTYESKTNNDNNNNKMIPIAHNYCRKEKSKTTYPLYFFRMRKWASISSLPFFLCSLPLMG